MQYTFSLQPVSADLLAAVFEASQDDGVLVTEILVLPAGYLWKQH